MAQFLGQMGFPDTVAAEFLAHELLQQQFAYGFQRCIGQQDFELPAAIFHIHPEPYQHAGIGWPADHGKAWVHLKPFEAEMYRAEWFKSRRQIIQHHTDQAFHQGAFDGGIRPAFNPHRRRPAPPTQQHIHH